MHLRPADVVDGAESYEHLGEVRISVMDMHPRYEALMQNRRVVVEENEAILTFGVDLPGPPPEVWSWMNEPEKRRLISLNPHDLKFIPILRPGGRTGAGATTHCVHGKAIAMRETVLDWKPFDYYTVEQDSGPMGVIQVTFQMRPIDDGRQTHLLATLNGNMRHLPSLLSRPFIRFCYTRIFNYAEMASKLKEVMEQSAAETQPEPVLAEPSLG
jgi:hypothetical protein